MSSLFSGHRKFARAGVVSAHTYGHAVDIAAVGEHLDRGQPAAGRDHRVRRPVGAAPPRRAPAAAGDLAARTGRTVVPASRSRRPHPRWLLGPRAFSARTGASSASTCSWRRARSSGCAASSAAGACRRAKGSCFARPARFTRSSCASRSTRSSSTATTSSSASSRRSRRGAPRAGAARSRSSSSRAASASARDRARRRWLSVVTRLVVWVSLRAALHDHGTPGRDAHGHARRDVICSPGGNDIIAGQTGTTDPLPARTRPCRPATRRATRST